MPANDTRPILITFLALLLVFDTLLFFAVSVMVNGLDKTWSLYVTFVDSLFGRAATEKM
jgi:hypothetical protein